ncbi:MAG: hypothetical protein ABJK64_02430 [Paraglaciecola sp.]
MINRNQQSVDGYIGKIIACLVDEMVGVICDYMGEWQESSYNS